MQLNQNYFKLSKIIIRLMQATVIFIAIVFPILHQQYISPSFEKIILQSAENDAERVTKYITHAIFLKNKETTSLTEKFKSDEFNITPEEREFLNDAVHYFELWKIKFFNSEGKVIFSTIKSEVGTVNTKPYFKANLAKGNSFITTSYREINPETKPHYFAEVYIPIMEKGAFIGVLEVYYDLNLRKEKTNFLINNITIMFIFSSIVSITLIIIMSFILDKLRKTQTGYQENLFNLASQDSLTKLLNRESMDFSIKQAIEKHEESHIDYSLIMFDIDHFKNINDTHGHQAGDDVLIELSKIINNRLRESDILGRYGGEEFIVLLPNTNAIGSKTVAENLRRIVEKASIQTCAGKLHITISIGVGTFTDIEELNLHTLIKDVDEAMYQSKRNGRNLVSYIQHSNNKEI
ncbi:GGDEF domain-containing protein [Marinomonas colpomeniae]|uniref:diguanylate cyclase n=1 Tax=Marinomonas colpomeniae TaxID=2774408 RepID=A0ABR8NVZ0_9GAMM|nr:GGDEF domain-containing protein [Marinomonas colpomeniae]MBD5770068.1 GGDEF domain-containing protein [Marinomonas colpomeniae]